MIKSSSVTEKTEDEEDDMEAMCEGDGSFGVKSKTGCELELEEALEVRYEGRRLRVSARAYAGSAPVSSRVPT